MLLLAVLAAVWGCALTPRSLARLAELRALLTDGAWRAELTADELAELGSAYDGLTPADIDAAVPWVDLAERYGEVYVYPLAEPTADESVQIEIVLPGEDLILHVGRSGRWSGLWSPVASDVYREAEGTDAASLVEWLGSVGWVPREPVAPAGLDPSPW